MGWRKTDDFDVLQAGFAAGGEDVVFGDLFLAFGVDDPEGGCASGRLPDSPREERG